MAIRSPFFYVGDKYKLISQLSDLFPKDINRLIEPFCGGGSVFLNISANEYISNDKNDWMIKLHNLFKSYKKDSKSFFNDFEFYIKKYGLSASEIGITVDDKLKKKFVKTYYAVFNKEAYRLIKNDFNKDKSQLLLLYVLLVYGFNHMLRFNSKGEFNLPVGNVDYNKNVKNALINYFDFISNNKITFHNKDFRTFINSIDFKEGDFLYLDPPYLISACEYNKDWTEKDDSDLLELLSILDKKEIKFALSNFIFHKGKENTKLKEWAKDFNVYPIKSNYISYHDNTIKNTVEVLITNY